MLDFLVSTARWIRGGGELVRGDARADERRGDDVEVYYVLTRILSEDRGMFVISDWIGGSLTCVMRKLMRCGRESVLCSLSRRNADGRHNLYNSSK